MPEPSITDGLAKPAPLSDQQQKMELDDLGSDPKCGTAAGTCVCLWRSSGVCCALPCCLSAFMSMRTMSCFICLTTLCVKDGCLQLLMSSDCLFGFQRIQSVSPFRPSLLTLSPVSVVCQIAALRCQLSPVWGSFLGWISVKWTYGIGRQSMTLSWDEREWEWWAPRHRSRVEGLKCSVCFKCT